MEETEELNLQTFWSGSWELTIDSSRITDWDVQLVREIYGDLINIFDLKVDNATFAHSLIQADVLDEAELTEEVNSRVGANAFGQAIINVLAKKPNLGECYVKLCDPQLTGVPKYSLRFRSVLNRVDGVTVTLHQQLLMDQNFVVDQLKLDTVDVEQPMMLSHADWRAAKIIQESTRHERMTRRKKWLIGVGLGVSVLVVALIVVLIFLPKSSSDDSTATTSVGDGITEMITISQYTTSTIFPERLSPDKPKPPDQIDGALLSKTTRENVATSQTTRKSTPTTTTEVTTTTTETTTESTTSKLVQKSSSTRKSTTPKPDNPTTILKGNELIKITDDDTNASLPLEADKDKTTQATTERFSASPPNLKNDTQNTSNPSSTTTSPQLSMITSSPNQNASFESTKPPELDEKTSFSEISQKPANDLLFVEKSKSTEAPDSTENPTTFASEESGTGSPDDDDFFGPWMDEDGSGSGFGELESTYNDPSEGSKFADDSFEIYD